MALRPVIAASARKHDVSDTDMIHAYRNPIRAFELDEGLTMLIGPDQAGNMLEIGVVAGDPVRSSCMQCEPGRGSSSEIGSDP